MWGSAISKILKKHDGLDDPPLSGSPTGCLNMGVPAQKLPSVPRQTIFRP
jgi:hypothetical protein